MTDEPLYKEQLKHTIAAMAKVRGLNGMPPTKKGSMSHLYSD